MTTPDQDHAAPAPQKRDAPHQLHADVGAAPPVAPATTRRMLTGVAVVAALLVVLLLASFIPRRAVTKELEAEIAGQDALPVVQVVTIRRGSEAASLRLPATVQPLHESAIYARVPGYVKSWRGDIGRLVHAGDELAVIDAPELAQQVAQAEQELAQSRAALGLSRADLARWKTLVADSAVTRQEFDQKQAAYDAAAANAGAAEANLQRLVAMQNFTRVRAPFTGVVTARNVDIGSLITAAGATSAPVAGGDVAGGAGPGSLFRLAQTDTVRTYISVPETQALSMTTQLVARVTVRELPGRTFTGRVARTARAIDPASRTMLVEVDIANPGLVLLPGMYADVQVTFPKAAAPLLVPATALVIRAAGTQVIVLDSATSTIHLRAVEVGRDYGATIEILNGISDGTVIVTNPTAELGDGMKVKVTAAPVEKE